MPTIGVILQTKISFNVAVNVDTTAQQKKMKQVFEATRETKMARIYDNQNIKGALGQSNRHTSRLKSQQTD
jgi:hypothetical protein